MDRKPLTNHAGIMGVVRGVEEIGRLRCGINGLEKRMRRNKMEDEDKTCGDCEYAYYSSKDDKWYCERPQEGYPIREVDPNNPTCSCFYEMEDEDKTCGDCEYAYFGLDGKDYCEWYGEIDLDDSACRWFHALPDMEE